MSNEIFVLFIGTIGLLGFALAIHLILFRKNSVPTKMLGWYTLLLTISSLEPLKQYFSTSMYLFEIVVGAGSFMIGPVLFVYCKYRIQNSMYWKRIDFLHFIPAGIFLILMIASPQTSVPEQEASVDVMLYVFFVCQVFAYTLTSLFLVTKEKKQGNPELLLQQFHLTFILFLVISSLVLFVYSFASTLIGFNTSFPFKLSIQAFLTLIIIVIVLLNAETLENHELRSETAKTFQKK